MRHLVTVEFSRPTHTPRWLNIFLVSLVSPWAAGMTAFLVTL